MLLPGQIARPKGGRPRKGNRYSTQMLEVGPGGTVGCVVTSSWVEWYFLHWFNGQHVAHVLPPLPCLPCTLNMPYRSHGYLAVLVEGEKNQRILHITERMFEEEPRLQAETGLRGLQLRVAKPGKGKNCRTVVRHEGYAFQPEKLPTAANVDLLVRQLFSGGGTGEHSPVEGEVKT